MKEDKLLSIAQCCERAAVSDDTIRRAIQNGRLKAHRLSGSGKRGRLRVYASDLEAYINSCATIQPIQPSARAMRAW